MAIYYVERGDSPRLTVNTKDEDGNDIVPDSEPTCKIFLGDREVEALSISNPSQSNYSTFWTVPSNAKLDTIYVATWSWVYGTKSFIKRDKIYVYQTGLSKR